MLGLNGSIRLWYIDTITDMRLGKYRLFEIAKAKFPNPYNGDAFSFLSKKRRTLKIVRYENHKIILYDTSYERGYNFMKPVFSEGLFFVFLHPAKGADRHRQDDPGIPLFKCPRD